MFLNGLNFFRILKLEQFKYFSETHKAIFKTLNLIALFCSLMELTFAVIKMSEGDSIWNILSYIPPKTNLFFSQSSLEHLDDISYFNQIKEYTEKYKEPIIQIHLVPAPFGLWLYLLHGIRQYTPRNISKLTRIFNKNDRRIIYQLGGKYCNRVHFKFITWPSLIMKIGDKRKSQPMMYKKALEDAITKDQKNGLKHPAFYAFIIHSHLDNKNVF